jgi:hypothetical protein
VLTPALVSPSPSRPGHGPIYTRATVSGEIVNRGDGMSRSKASRARVRALQALAYRAWYIAPATADVPPLDVLTDPRLQRREKTRQLRRAQVGLFDTVAPTAAWPVATAA